MPRSIKRNLVSQEAPQSRQALSVDLNDKAALTAILVIFDRGLAPGRRIPRGDGFRPWLLDHTGGDHHLERGGDQAGPIGAGAGGFCRPPCGHARLC